MPWPVPAGDDDCDGFTTADESFMGTAPLVLCAGTLGADNEPPPDAWPFDFNDDQKAMLGDVLRYIGRVNTSPPNPNYDVRYDLNASGNITLADPLRYIAVMNLSCAP